MQLQSIAPHSGARRAPSTIGRDLLLAGLLALALSLSWAIQDWPNLSQLIQPDPDDMMRLAQVRDWLAGQGINDWAQYRMAPPLGAPMHWSRVNDFGIAALILGFTPLLGRHEAELIAILAYPALLFAMHLYFSARIGRRLWGAEAAMIAVVLGALAYPGTTVFAPGRIDHHALQVVLIEIAVLAAMRSATLASGTVAGGGIALSLVVGLETVPQLAALVGVLFVFWIVRGDHERTRLAGVALGLGATTAPFVLFLRPTLWSASLCDAFTPATSNATFAGAGVLGLLALATPALRSRPWRAGIGSAAGAATLAAILTIYPACLAGPYGQVDPFLLREFIPHIDEANGIFEQVSLGRKMQLGGLMLIGMLGAGWVAWHAPRAWRQWAPLASVVAASGLITLAQVRGTYVGTPLSAPLLAGVILAARHRRPPNVSLLIGAWVTCAGMGWYGAPVLIEKALSRLGGRPAEYLTPVPARAFCNTGAAWRSVDRYPPGVVMAPTSIAAFMTGATRMATVGAGYHRNDRGNMAMYRYFLGAPDRSAVIAREWKVRYVAFCPGDFGEIDVTHRYPRSLATLLQSGVTPRGFQRLPLRGTRLRLYRVGWQ
jgi:hypothetical protein